MNYDGDADENDGNDEYSVSQKIHPADGGHFEHIM